MYTIHGTLAGAAGMAAAVIGMENLAGYTVLGAAVIFAFTALRPLLPRRRVRPALTRGGRHATTTSA